MYDKKIVELCKLLLTKESIGAYLRYNPDVKLEICKVTNFLVKKVTLRERCFYIAQNLQTQKTCKNCGSPTLMNMGLTDVRFCSNKCAQSSKITQEKIKSTNLERYGTITPLQNDKVKQKINATKIDRYGNSGYNNRKQAIETTKQKYGVDNISQVAEIKEKKKKTFDEKWGGIGAQSSDIQSKIKTTNLERYGVEHIIETENVQLKIKTINVERYGVEYPFQNAQVQQKAKINKKENYINSYVDNCKKIHTVEYGYPDIIGNSHDYIEITCFKHGIFKQRQYHHMQGQGCPICACSSHSAISIQWIKYIIKKEGIHIQHAENGGEFKIIESIINNDKRTGFSVDGYCAETNTIYEFLGDYWHGNLKIFESLKKHPNLYCTYGEAYETTMQRLTTIKKYGYNVVYIWESDFNKIIKEELKNAN